jgi:glutathione S-transferase
VVTSTLTGWRGAMTLKSAIPGTQPELPLQLFDMEACPYCRSVREALTALHLDAEIYPCPKGGTRFRAEAERLGGKQQFPLLVDRNTGVIMYESVDIIDYLFASYGHRQTPKLYRGKRLKPLLGGLGSAVRGLRGLRARASRLPEQKLQLWSFEASPYTRLVRERLCELEIPYVVHNLGKEHWTEAGPAVRRIKAGPLQAVPGGKRERHLARVGEVQLPYLEDPNTGVSMFESADIIDYIESEYAL